MVKFIALALLASCVAVPAVAETPTCRGSDETYAILMGDHKERRVSIGVDKEGYAMSEIWANPETGTWTVLMTSPTKISCIVLSGFNYFPTIIPADGDPA